MVATPPNEEQLIGDLIVDTKELLRGIKEFQAVNAAEARGRPREAHNKRDHSRHRPRSPPSKRPTSVLKLVARYKGIAERFLARLAETEKRETQQLKRHGPDIQERETLEEATPEQETPEQETPEHEVSALPSQGHVAGQIPTERRLSKRRTGNSDLRFPCLPPQLGKNMVATIHQARTALLCHNVDERGYLILQVQECWDASELAQLLRGAEALDRDEIKGFALAQGDADCLHARVAADVSLNLCEMEGFDEACVSQQPKEDPPAAFNT